MASPTVNTISVIAKSSRNAGLVSSYPTANGENDATSSAHTRIVRPLESLTGRDPSSSGAPLRNRISVRPAAAVRRALLTSRHSSGRPPRETEMSTATCSGPRLYPLAAAGFSTGASVTVTGCSRFSGSSKSTMSETLSSIIVTVTLCPFT